MDRDENGSAMWTRLNRALKKPSVLFFLFSFVFVFWFQDLLRPYDTKKNEHNFVWDAAGYYSYLPALIHNDGSFDRGGYSFFLPISGQGHHYPKYTYGVAAMELPFYGLACAFAYFTDQPLDGYSPPFVEFIRWGSVFYVLLGLFFLRNLLIRYYSETAVAIALFCCLFGSMLYTYTFIQSELSHGPLFFLFSLFIYLTDKWHKLPGHGLSVSLAAILGLISVVRFTEIYIVLVFVFWNMNTWSALKEKLKSLRQNFKFHVWFPILGFLFWVPQMFFWKHYLGSYIFDSYVNERFFWTDPQIINVLFTYRKGLITYSPIFFLAFIGVFFMRKDFPLPRFSLWIILALTVYIFSCWWDWAYGGCFGNRAFCEEIAILSLPLAAMADRLLSSTPGTLLKQSASVFFLVLIFICAFQNVGQSYQYQNQRVIHGWATSKSIFWGSFRKYHYGEDFVNPYWTELRFRNQDAWLKGLEREDTVIYIDRGK